MKKKLIMPNNRHAHYNILSKVGVNDLLTGGALLLVSVQQ
jgi:hypothetical protein